MSRKIRWAAFLIAMILSFAAEQKVLASCVNNSNSSMTCDESGSSCYCAGTGGGCSACYSGGGGSKWQLCYYDWNTGDLDCVYSN
jgi:hypothetical protein